MDYSEFPTSRSALLEKFTKCGNIYKSSCINEKQYLLCCVYCEEIFCHFEYFLEHTEKHQNTLVKWENEGNFKDGTTICQESLAIENDLEMVGDPLEEEDYDFLNISPTVKMENFDESESVVQKMFIPNKQAEEKMSDNADDTDIETSDSNFEPDEDELNDNPSVETDDENDVLKTPEGNTKIHLKRFTKKRDFIRTIIEAYKQHAILWDTTNKSSNSEAKLMAYNVILSKINDKYHINATAKQIEMIVKRLRLRFIYHYRIKLRKVDGDCDEVDNSKSLWFYDLMKFIEPHLQDIKLKQKTNVCQQFTDEQFLKLFKLLKENECLWNELNVYYTSTNYRQECLQAMANSFDAFCCTSNFTATDMKHIVEELQNMAVTENRRKVKLNQKSEYQALSKFYDELTFLLPHVGPFNCKYCPRNFSDIYAYKVHTSKHEGTKAFKCMICQRELRLKKEFIYHMRRHTKECPFQCEVCEKSFPSKKEWKRHIIRHGSKPFVCELCASSFYTQHQLTNHMKNHANIRDHICSECGKGFTHRGLLRQHLQTHNKTECECPLCHNKYSNPRSLRKHHVRVHHGLPDDSSSHLYNCKICMITFATLQEAKKHRKEHNKCSPARRKYVCDICGHDFAFPRNLADHKKIHLGIRDHVCDVCGKSFTNPNLLKQHRNIHTGQKFVCKACGKDYAHYRGLSRHVAKVHAADIKELCTIIEKPSNNELQTQPQL